MDVAQGCVVLVAEMDRVRRMLDNYFGKVLTDCYWELDNRALTGFVGVANYFVRSWLGSLDSWGWRVVALVGDYIGDMVLVLGAV